MPLTTPPTHDRSPLAQVQRTSRRRQKDTGRKLSAPQQHKLHQILEGKLDYMYNECFDEPNAQKQIFDEAPEIQQPDVTWYHPVMDSISSPRDTPKNNGSVLLTAAQERVLFFQFNYCRYQVAQLAEQLDPDHIDPQIARDLLQWNGRAEAYREQIANTNLALVLAMAKRTRMSEVDFADLVSEGNMALLRAIDKFDAARGFKFSTYACRAILKAFSRQGVKLSKYRGMFPTDFDPKLEKSDFAERRREDHEADCADEIKDIFLDNRADLTDIEQEVIEHRFQLSDDPSKLEKHQRDDGKPLTLEQVGKIIGVTKERVRQIQNKALDKIRVSLEDDFLT